MISAARNIHDQLKTQPEIKHRKIHNDQNHSVIEKLENEYKDHQVVVTGHSLGAGTAVILGLLLRSVKSIRNRLKVYAYGVPGGLLNNQARQESMKFMVSVIHNDDVISRLSIRSIVNLRNEVRKTLLDCNEPKYKIINTGFCSALGAFGKCCFGLCCCCCHSCNRKDGDVFNDISNNMVDGYECCSCLRVQWTNQNEKEFEDVEEGRKILNCTCTNEIDDGQLMLPAGTLIHLVPIPSGNGNTYPKYSIKVVDEDKFDNINVCSNMVSDHMPPGYINSLKVINQQWNEQIKTD